jgi:minor extracellular serine protease Vpr
MKLILLAGFLCTNAWAMDAVRVETKTDLAETQFGVNGTGVTIAILDRGINFRNADFRKADGSTRIRAMLDQTGFNSCTSGTAVEYTEAQINAALIGGPNIAMRDAVGHGDATAGTAAGNGRSLASLKYRGIAPNADLIIAKVTSEGAPAHDGELAEPAFNGCLTTAIDWVGAKMNALGQPGVILINSGTQFGPMDGSSIISQKLDSVFGANTPGRIVVLPSGDEGGVPNHASTTFNSTGSNVTFNHANTNFTVISGWYTGSVPAVVTLTLSDGTVVGPVQPSTGANVSGITLNQYTPGAEFYPWTSNSGDRAIYIGFSGHQATGTLRISALGGGSGTVHWYSDLLGPNLSSNSPFTSNLAVGRIQDYATTRSAIVAADYNLRTNWTDLDGVARSILTEGAVGGLWSKSSGGPTRDGRQGIDITAPGQNLFASSTATSYWGTFRFNLDQGSGGFAGRFGGTSGSAPIVLGAVALMLQRNPALTANQARTILRNTARSDSFTGAVPNNDWGYGKLDVQAAVAASSDQILKNGFE